MPLPPLPEPDDPRERLLALAKALPTTGLLFTTLIAFNGAQTLSTALIPVSRRSFRTFNRWAANLWWGWCVTLAKELHGVRLQVSGDDVPPRENAIVVLNHQDMADITFLMHFARSKERLGDMKWIVKDIIKYVPGVGWGMLFLDCVFVKRDWTADRESIRRAFARLQDEDIPVWLISFSEGTRLRPDKLARSRRYAREHDLPELRHVQLPRTKGFVATVQGLRSHVAAVYDLTLAYERGVPTLWQYIKGYSKRAHLHVQRFPIESLPAEPDELAAWLLARFCAKDELLERFYQDGAFPT